MKTASSAPRSSPSPTLDHFHARNGVEGQGLWFSVCCPVIPARHVGNRSFPTLTRCGAFGWGTLRSNEHKTLLPPTTAWVQSVDFRVNERSQTQRNVLCDSIYGTFQRALRGDVVTVDALGWGVAWEGA